MARYYADILVAPIITFGNISVPLYQYIDPQSGLSTYYGLHTVDVNKMAKLPFGVRVGFESMTTKKIDWYYGIEASLRPGYNSGTITDNVYLSFKIGFGLGFKVGK